MASGKRISLKNPKYFSTDSKYAKKAKHSLEIDIPDESQNSINQTPTHHIDPGEGNLNLSL
jgi:hypothetical protein